jgi:Flp pilus assembly protein CpaB
VVVLVLGLGKPSAERESSLAGNPATIEVLFTTQDIEEGVELKPVLFRKESRPARDFAASNVVRGVEQLRGVYAASFLPAGQMARAPINSVVPKIRPGLRAISIKLDKQTTNEGWARAGVRVDVMIVTRDGPRSLAAVIAQNLRVLSSGMSVSSEFGGESRIGQNSESTVTLEVSAEDQQRLKLASGRGELRLLLRGDEDSQLIAERLKIGLDGIVSLATEKPQAAPDQGWVVIDGKRYRVSGDALVPG